MRNKHATTRAIKGGTRFTHRGVNYLQVGSGWMGSVYRESDGKLVAWLQIAETPREAVDRALSDSHPMSPNGPPRLRRFQRRRQGGRILGWRTLSRRELLGRGES